MKRPLIILRCAVLSGAVLAVVGLCVVPTRASDVTTLLVIPASLPTAQEDVMAGVGEGFLAILRYRLSEAPSVDLLNREHLDAALHEWTLLSGRLRELSEPRRPELIPADYVVTLSVLKVESAAVGVAQIVCVDTMEIVHSHRVRGATDRLLDIAEQLSSLVTHSLGIPAESALASPEENNQSVEAPENNSLLASVHFIRALSYYQANHPQKAIYHLWKVDARDPSFELTDYWLGRSFLLANEPEHARLAFERFVKLHPGHPQAARARVLKGQIER